MGNFSRGNRFGGGARRNFDEMHRATCSKCGRPCEVPFKPRGDRPVFCNSCFASNRNPDSRFERRDSDRPSFNRSSSDDRPMFKATCDECGKECNLPFQPKNGKPVYCSKCFETKDSRGGRSNDQSKEQFEKINAKLDRILKYLTPVTAPKFIQKEKTEQKPEAIKVKKEAKKKKVSAKK